MNIRKLLVMVGVGTQDGFASKVTDFLGKTFIDDPARLGLPDDFYWDEEDRYRLRGKEATEPKLQRARYAAEEFRRMQRKFISIWMLPVVTVVGAVLLIVSSLVVGASGIGQDGTDEGLLSVSRAIHGATSPRSLTDEQLAMEIERMQGRGVTMETASGQDKALIEEYFRRRGSN